MAASGVGGELRTWCTRSTVEASSAISYGPTGSPYRHMATKAAQVVQKSWLHDWGATHLDLYPSSRQQGRWPCNVIDIDN